MANDLFQVSLLTEDEVSEGTTEVKLPEEPKEVTKEPKEEKKTIEEAVSGVKKPKIEILLPEEAGLEEETDETTGEVKIKPVEPTKGKEEVALDYKALAESRIKNGAWEEYENWNELKDTVEWTPELFEKLETEQFQAKVARAVDEEKSSYGNQAKLLIDHLKNGGTVQDLLPSIQQETDVESLDENDVDAAEELVRAECQAKGWSDKRTKAYIDGLKDQGEDLLKETAKEAKSALKSIIEEERQEIVNQQAIQAKQAREYWEGFNKKVRESVFKDEELSPKEQKDLEKFAFDFKHQDPKTGQKYSDFNLKFEEIKKDPVSYAKFVKVIKNFDKIVNKEVAKKEATKEISFLLRGAQSNLGSNKTTESPEFKKSNSQKGQYNPFELRKN